MKTTFKYSSILKCDMVKVRETGTEIFFEEACEEKFYTGSYSRLTRTQAEHKAWVRVKVGRVKWPGSPPSEPGKKVDLCPKHSVLVMTEEEAKAARKAEREAKKLARAAEKAAKAELKAAAPKKPRKPRKPKIESGLQAETQGG